MFVCCLFFLSTFYFIKLNNNPRESTFDVLVAWVLDAAARLKLAGALPMVDEKEAIN